MNARQRRELLIKIKENVKCPYCRADIHPSQVHIHEKSKDAQTLHIHCTECNADFGGSAVSKQIPTKIGEKMNASTRMYGTSFLDSMLSKNEVHVLKESIQTSDSLSKLFSKTL